TARSRGISGSRSRYHAGGEILTHRYNPDSDAETSHGHGATPSFMPRPAGRWVGSRSNLAGSGTDLPGEIACGRSALLIACRAAPAQPESFGKDAATFRLPRRSARR